MRSEIILFCGTKISYISATIAGSATSISLWKPYYQTFWYSEVCDNMHDHTHADTHPNTLLTICYCIFHIINIHIILHVLLSAMSQKRLYFTVERNSGQLRSQSYVSVHENHKFTYYNCNY